MRNIEEIDANMLDNAKKQQQLFEELNDLAEERSNVIHKMGFYTCEHCTAYGKPEDMPPCEECGYTFCKDHNCSCDEDPNEL